MRRVTVRMPENMVDTLDALVEQGEFHNRSEAIRVACGDLDGVDAPGPWGSRP